MSVSRRQDSMCTCALEAWKKSTASVGIPAVMPHASFEPRAAKELPNSAKVWDAWVARVAWVTWAPSACTACNQAGTHVSQLPPRLLRLKARFVLESARGQPLVTFAQLCLSARERRKASFGIEGGTPASCPKKERERESPPWGGPLR